jgi:rare lipoprotein A
LTVTNKQNNKKVTVRVNDRGPFVSARIIDVSRAAASILDMLVTGTAPVLIENSGVQVRAQTQASPAAPQVQTRSISIAPAAAASPLSASPATAVPVQSQIAQPALTQSISMQSTEFIEPMSPVQPLASAAWTQTPQAAVPQTAAPQTAAPVYTQSVTTAELTPAVTLDSSTLYRIQVGSYKVPRNAVDAFDKLKNSGLNPAYERNGEYFRVVLAGIHADEVQSIRLKLGEAGFRSALIRTEGKL